MLPCYGHATFLLAAVILLLRIKALPAVATCCPTSTKDHEGVALLIIVARESCQSATTSCSRRVKMKDGTGALDSTLPHPFFVAGREVENQSCHLIDHRHHAGAAAEDSICIAEEEKPNA